MPVRWSGLGVRRVRDTRRKNRSPPFLQPGQSLRLERETRARPASARPLTRTRPPTHTHRTPLTLHLTQQINKFAPATGRGTDHYCEYCGVWLKNHPRVVAMHEQAAPHKAAVAKSVSMRGWWWRRRRASSTRTARGGVPESAHPLFFSLLFHAELHELRVKAEKDKADEASLKKSMAKIEADAKARFEADQAAAEAAQKALGTWVSCGRGARVLAAVG